MIIPVILCGGAGSRLWPVSREDLPKPFLPLVDGTSTFALTLARIADKSVFGPAIVVGSAGHRHLIEAGLAAAGVGATVLLEPGPRDTTAAIAAAASFVAGVDPGATILILPADHAIRQTAAFAATVGDALPAAEAGRIVVFGIAPDHPATGYGYIRPGGALGDTTARAVDAFVEKPDVARAKEFVAAGYLWNSGIFLMRTNTAIAELGMHAPAILRAAEAAVANAAADGSVISLAPEPFLAAPSQSFDYAVMEKTGHAAVVEARFDWSDLGTWSAVWAAASKDDAGNVTAGDTVLVDTKGSYVSTETQRIGVLGLDNVVVVAGDGAVLVTTREHAAAVKDLVAAIESRPEKVIGDFIRHYRPWGHYQSLDVGKRHQVKRIVVNPGQRLSLQKHARRAEYWTVVEGVAEITVGMDIAALDLKSVREGEHIHIPRGAIHRMANRGATPMTLIEVQVGDYLGEDDIVRLEDDYGR